MKLLRLQITNVGAIADLDLPINKPLIIFYGEVRQGKTTILNAVRWAWGGAFPSDIIRHGQDEACIQATLDDNGVAVVIRREFYRSKDGVTKARDLSLTRAGVEQKRPVNHIAPLLNPFLLDQNHLANMNERERAAFFVKLFDIDTSKEDQAIERAAAEAQQLRATIKGYGEIDLSPVARVDVAELQQKLADIRTTDDIANNAAQNEIKGRGIAYARACEEIQIDNEDARSFNQQIDEKERRAQELRAIIAQATTELTAVTTFLAGNKRATFTELPPAPDLSDLHAKATKRTDTSALEAQLRDAGAQNVRAEQYEANRERARQRDLDKDRLAHLEEEQRLFKISRTAKLAEHSDKCGVPDMIFTDNGSFMWEGVEAGMLSTSQIMRLSQAVSKLYPAGFGLELIDRGESLGKSVFDLVKDAEANDRTILCTVVGDRPAATPAQVGVYVVEKGVVS